MDEIEEVINHSYIIKDYVKKQHYLEVNMLILANYMSPKLRQIISYLSFAYIRMSLVSFKPTITKELYTNICNRYNLTPYLFDKKFNVYELIIIISNLFQNNDVKLLYNSIFSI